MKILLLGFLVFSGWSSLSTYLYVCKIKGLCSEPTTVQMVVANYNEKLHNDTVSKQLVQEPAKIPGDLTIYFAFDKSEFKPDAQAIRYLTESNAYFEQNSHARLSITGYTDSVGSVEYNQGLGYRRAQSMQRYFVSKGVVVSKIKLESKGEKDPADDNATDAGRANNRRTAITINK